PSAGDLATQHLQQSRGGANRSQSIAYTDGPASQFDLRRDSASPLAQRSFNPFATQRSVHIPLDKRDTIGEDNIFRESILECMFRAIGLTGNSSLNKDADSNQASPRLSSFEQRRQKT